MLHKDDSLLHKAWELSQKKKNAANIHAGERVVAIIDGTKDASYEKGQRVMIMLDSHQLGIWLFRSIKLSFPLLIGCRFADSSQFCECHPARTAEWSENAANYNHCRSRRSLGPFMQLIEPICKLANCKGY